MKFAHNIKFRIFCKEEDEPEKIISKLQDIIDFNWKKEKIQLVVGRRMEIFYIYLEKTKHTNKVLKYIFSKFNDEQKELLKSQIESRLDKDLHFYLRLDKEKLLNDEYKITDSGKCLHINIAIAAYPHKRKIAKKKVKELIETDF